MDIEIKNTIEKLREAQQEHVPSWRDNLRKKGKNVRENSAYNARLCIDNTPELKGIFRYNEFARLVEKTRGIDKWGIQAGQSYDDDAKIIDYYLEDLYNFVFPEKKVSQAALVIAKQDSFNPVKDWIEQEPWDGVKRADKLFIDTLGAENSAYIQNVTHVFLLELVSRVYHPGAKCDIVPMLHSKEQGIGKSTVLRNLCPNDDTFDDSLITMGLTKDDYGQIQGKLVVEIGELSAMKRSGIARVKQFITSQNDHYREPYGTATTSHPRTCVFAGTTNQSEFLTDTTGNRRFALIECHGGKRVKSPFDGDRHYYQQILAEAKTWYDKGEKPVLSDEADRIAKEKANAAMEDDVDKENIIAFLNMLVPECWHDMTLYQKRDYFIHRNDRLFSKSTQDIIGNDDCNLPLDYATTAECLSIIFNIDTTKAVGKEAGRLQSKLAIVAPQQGWKHTNHIQVKGSNELRGYENLKRF